jgi:hypothetical protein
MSPKDTGALPRADARLAADRWEHIRTWIARIVLALFVLTVMSLAIAAPVWIITALLVVIGILLLAHLVTSAIVGWHEGRR